MKKTDNTKSGTPTSMRDSMKRAVTELLILTLLRERPMYTYDLMQALEQRSGGVLEFNALYIALHRLQDNGFVLQEQRTVSEQNRMRVYYGITPAGAEYLTRLRATYFELTDAIGRIVMREGA